MSRNYLSREEAAELFAAATDDLVTVREFADENGLAVEMTNPAKRLVQLTGTAASFEQAFDVELLRFEQPNGTFRGFEGEFEIPDELGSSVLGVFGLDNRPLFDYSIAADYLTEIGGPAEVPPGPTLQDLAGLYAFPANGGTGEVEPREITVGILRIGGAFDQDQITQYFNELAPPGPGPGNIGNIPFVGTNQITAANTSSDGVFRAQIETCVDIEVIGNLAPGANIVVYYANGLDAGSLAELISDACQDTTYKPDVLSASWGVPEYLWSTGQPETLDSFLIPPQTTGVTFCAATGDSGSSGWGYGQPFFPGPHVVLPAACPHALACGGTLVTINDDGSTSEDVWNQPGLGATGGGVSERFPLPAWQGGMEVPPSPEGAANRGVPDVAAHAGLTHFVVSGAPPGKQDQFIGGTSTSTPIWAALLACIDSAAPKNVGFVSQYLYEQYAQGSGVQAFNDITDGTNEFEIAPSTGNQQTPAGYDAGAGWDACSGLGSPVGNELKAILLK